MSILDFFNNSQNNKNIIYVLDRLLQIALDDEVIHGRKIDLGLYKILNDPKVNQEVIHMGCLPIIRENMRASNEFVGFINNLWIYMEYDINADFLWAKTTDSQSSQKSIYEKIVSARKDILQYLFDKKLISNEIFTSQLNYKVKSLTD